MLDQSIPYVEPALSRPSARAASAEVSAPPGYSLRFYQAGDEKEWARIETAVGKFESERNAFPDFLERFLSSHAFPKRFIAAVRERPAGRAAGSCMLWTRQSGAPMLHWLAVDPLHGDADVKTALMRAVLRLHDSVHPGKSISLHTQTWRHQAIGLYIRLGFCAARRRPFPDVKSDWETALPNLRKKMRPKLFMQLKREMI